MDSYINNLNYKNYKNNILQCIFFGQTFGVILMLIGIINYINSKKIVFDNFYISLIIIGFILFIVGIVYPKCLNKLLKLFNYITDKIFILISYILLLIIYLIVVVPLGLFIKDKWMNKYKFYSWENDFNTSSSFVEIKDNITIINNKKSNRFKTIKKLLINVLNNKVYILLPTILIIILISIFFYFITSPVISPMIYSLF